jgi:hypothetical protein
LVDGSNVDEVSDAIGDRDLGEYDLRPDPTCDAPSAQESGTNYAWAAQSRASGRDWALAEASLLMGGTV